MFPSYNVLHFKNENFYAILILLAKYFSFLAPCVLTIKESLLFIKYKIVGDFVTLVLTFDTVLQYGYILGII